jgi:molecular chaperone GrpE (heat shock protein)
MVPGEEKAEVSLSSEFFKKLNQQIVQKDNLIKLLQLQIKNLKSQLDETAVDTQKKDDSGRLLDAKESEIQSLKAELEEQRSQLSHVSQEKNREIEALNRAIEELKQVEPPPTEMVDASGLADLQAQVDRLTAALNQEKESAQLTQEAFNQEKATFQEELETLKLQLAEIPPPAPGPDPELEQQLENLKEENEGLQAKTAELTAELAAAAAEVSPLQERIAELEAEAARPVATVPAEPPAELTGRISELELDIQNLRALLDEKDAEINRLQEGVPPAPDGADPAALEEAEGEIAELKAQVSHLTVQAGRVGELEGTIAELRGSTAEVKSLETKIAQLESESVNFSETAMKMTALESEREKLSLELENAQRAVVKLQQELQETTAAADNSHALAEKDLQIATLKQQLAEFRTADQAGEATKAEVEQLTNQIADQLLAIQKFEDILRQHQDKLAVKDQEIAILQDKLGNRDDTPQPIHVSSESDIIANFIDFFDGLDAYLTSHPSAELQSLHRKLLDRLILPNQIAYLPVISEQFDSNKHIATDYFRSDRFPERCIVFEVEKGYSQGDIVVKKAKVWVVQNLFDCKACGATQSHSDSKFCHMCGAKMVAPNNLPVDNLPVFEPTSTTYLRFAERMLEKKLVDKAKVYLNDGLKLDPNSVPVLVKLADVHALASEFDDAIASLQKASLLKPDAKISDKIKNLEVRNSIFQQARNLDLPPEELEKLVSLIQKK